MKVLKKRNILFIILIFMCSITYSQSNSIDNNGFKQGKWIHYIIDTVIQNWVSFGVIPSDSIDTYNKDIDRGGSSGTDTIVKHKLWKEGLYNDDFMVGLWKFYDCNIERYYKDTLFGSLLYEINYKKDTINGLVKTYYPSGKLKGELNVINNRVEGVFNYYFETGVLKYTGNIIPNKDVIEGVEYYKTGSKKMNRKFDYDIVVNDLIGFDKIINYLK